jgi:hypothetical protein
MQARGDSALSVIRAKGQAEANRLLQSNLTEVMLQYEVVKKWDGKLPVYQGSGGNSIINVPTIKK